MKGSSGQRPLSIRGGQLLTGGDLAIAGLRLEDGRVAAVDAAPEAGDRVLDASGLMVLPGIVDMHGDAFERQIMPRPKVRFAYDLALMDTDRQLVANGITTAYHGLTLSWEPGLRIRAAGQPAATGLRYPSAYPLGDLCAGCRRGRRPLARQRTRPGAGLQ